MVKKYALQRQPLSLTLGITIGLLAGLAHANSIQEHRQAAASLPSEPLITAVSETPTVPPEPYNDPNIPDNGEEAVRAAGETYLLSSWKPLHFMRAALTVAQQRGG